MYWARALADQSTDVALAERFKPVAAALEENEKKILGELNGAQGSPQDVGGYYQPAPFFTSLADGSRPTRP